MIAGAIKTNKLFLLGLLALSLIVRVLFFGTYLSHNRRFVHDDSAEYHMMATKLAAGQGYKVEGTPYVYRLPGYPFFLSLCYRVLGAHQTRALLVQVVLASIIPLLIFLLALVLFPGNVLLAQAASLWGALHIGFVLYAGSLMTESLFIVFLLLFLVSFLWQLRVPPALRGKTSWQQAYLYGFCPEPGCEGPSYTELFWDVGVEDAPVPVLPPAFFGCGLLLGIASLIRPVGPFVLVLSLLWIAASSPQKIRRGLSLTLGWCAFVVPWLVRNYMLFGLVAFHSLPGPHFLNLSASRVVMQVQGTGLREAKKVVNDEANAAMAALAAKQERPLNELERSRVQVGVATGYFAAYPLQALKNWATDIMRTGLSLYSSFIMHLEQGRKSIKYFSHKRTTLKLFKHYLLPHGVPWYVVLLIWFEIISYLFLLIGLADGFLRALRSRAGLLTWLQSLSYIALFIGIGLAGGYARMRLPVEGLIIILGVHFWVSRLRNTGAA